MEDPLYEVCNFRLFDHSFYPFDSNFSLYVFQRSLINLNLSSTSKLILLSVKICNLHGSRSACDYMIS